VYYTAIENDLQVLALVRLGWRLCSTNRACTHKIAFSSLVIQITILDLSFKMAARTHRPQGPEVENSNNILQNHSTTPLSLELRGKKVSHYGKIVKMCQFYSDSSRFFCNQLYLIEILFCLVSLFFVDCKFCHYFVKN
jgi:hypothetical protein